MPHDPDVRLAAASEAAAAAPGGVVGPGTDADSDRSIPPPPPRRRGRRPLVLLIGLVFLFTPAVAHLAGVRATEIENRPLAEFPSVSQGWDFFPAMTGWAVDHLPLRDRAVEANSRLSQGVFGEAPQLGGPATGAAGPVAPAPGDEQAGERSYPAVLQGTDGWLFYGGDVSVPCEPVVPLDRTFAGLTRFGELVRQSGRPYVFTVAPDKATMSPDRLPETYVGDDCAPPASAAFWERLEQSPPPGYVDLRSPLEQVQDEVGEELYRPSDSHWGPRGSLVYARVLAEALDPELWRSSRPTATAPVQLNGDLAGLLGAPRTDEVPGWELRRPGVVVTQATGDAMASSTSGAPLWAAPTLVIGDSFTKTSVPQLAPLFASARIVPPSLAADDPQAMLAAVLAADTVVLQIVERYVHDGEVPVVDPAFLDLLEQSLGAAG